MDILPIAKMKISIWKYNRLLLFTSVSVAYNFRKTHEAESIHALNLINAGHHQNERTSCEAIDNWWFFFAGSTKIVNK